MPKKNGQSASTWRQRDAAYRAQEKARRVANAAKRKARGDQTSDAG